MIPVLPAKGPGYRVSGAPKLLPPRVHCTEAPRPAHLSRAWVMARDRAVSISEEPHFPTGSSQPSHHKAGAASTGLAVSHSLCAL